MGKDDFQWTRRSKPKSGYLFRHRPFRYVEKPLPDPYDDFLTDGDDGIRPGDIKPKHRTGNLSLICRLITTSPERRSALLMRWTGKPKISRRRFNEWKELGKKPSGR